MSQQNFYRQQEHNLNCSQGVTPSHQRTGNSLHTSGSTGRLKYIPEQKLDKSHKFFKTTRVNSCSFIKMNKGVPKAVPYYNPPKQSYADKMGKSEFTNSLSHATFKVRPTLHTGMSQKPLSLYDPQSYRNRLPVLDAKAPSTNGSQIQIGDRSEKYHRHFISSSRNTYGNFGKFDPVSNPGILSEKTRWHHHLQSK